MRLIQNDRVIVQPFSVALCFGKQNAVGHDLDEGLAGCFLLKACLVGHRPSAELAHL